MKLVDVTDLFPEARRAEARVEKGRGTVEILLEFADRRMYTVTLDLDKVYNTLGVLRRAQNEA